MGYGRREVGEMYLWKAAKKRALGVGGRGGIVDVVGFEVGSEIGGSGTFLGMA